MRIEDTDQERYVEGAVDIIYRTLEKTGLVIVLSFLTQIALEIHTTLIILYIIIF